MGRQGSYLGCSELVVSSSREGFALKGYAALASRLFTHSIPLRFRAMSKTSPENGRRDFLRNTLASGIALGISPSLLKAQPPPPIAPFTGAPADPYAIVDPELVPALKALPKLVLNSQMLPTIRQQESAPAPLPPPAPQPVERRIPGPPGAPELRLIIIDPAPG